jgi:hypothetical protein
LVSSILPVGRFGTARGQRTLVCSDAVQCYAKLRTVSLKCKQDHNIR